MFDRKWGHNSLIRDSSITKLLFKDSLDRDLANLSKIGAPDYINIKLFKELN